MFISRRAWNELQEKLYKMEDRQLKYLSHISEIADSLQKQGKQQFVWDLREEEMELMKDGRKLRAVRKIVK